MSGRLAGRKALASGAGQGIGRASALLFAAEGAETWTTDRDSASLAGLDSWVTRLLDVCDPQAIAATFAEARPRRLRRPPADGPDRQGRGDRRAGPLLRLGRLRLHHGAGACGGRGMDGLKRVSPPAPERLRALRYRR